MTRRIATLGGGYSWETTLVAALGNGAGPLTVVRRCADMTDLLTLAATGQLDACVVTVDARGLGADAVSQLAGYGVRVIIVRGGGHHAINADGVGAAGVVPADLPVTALIDEVSRVLSAEVPAGAPADTEIADPVLALSASHVPLFGDAEGGVEDSGAAKRHRRRRGGVRRGEERFAPSRREGTVVAVWGPRGAPGRTTVAVGMADAAVAAGRSVILVDADVYGGVLAMALGILDESAGLAGACRLSVAGTLDADRFSKLCWSVGPRLAALTGIPRADRWPEVRASTIASVLAMARTQAELVIVDCAPLLEADEELTFDTMAPRRNGATLAVLDAADQVLAVGSADPPGVERLVRGLAELTERDEVSPPFVLFNRVRDSAASPAELTAALRRFSDRAPAGFLPEDRGACDAAWRHGRLLSEVAPKSTLTKAFSGLLDSLQLAAQ